MLTCCLIASYHLSLFFGLKTRRNLLMVSITNSLMPFHLGLNSNFNLLIKSSRFLLSHFSITLLFIVISLLLTANINIANALSATTSNVINGSAPYLTFDGGLTKAENTEVLLAITLADEMEIKANEDVSSFIKPIELPQSIKKFSDIKTVVPLPTSGNSYYPSFDLNNLIGTPYNYWGDDDGDGDISATGSITVKWQDNMGNDITANVKANPTELLSTSCAANYQLTIKATSGELSTRYGSPKKSTFNAIEHTYYIKPHKNNITPCSVLYAQPNLAHDDTAYGDYYNENSNGETWVAWKGYKVSSASNNGNYENDSSIKENNFPSTGSHGLYFYLLFEGITPAEVLAANGNLVSAEEGGNVSLILSTENTPRWRHEYYGPKPYGYSEPGLKITLKGPRYNSNDKSFNPVTFKLYADSSKNKLLYEFRLMRWYIAQPNVVYNGTGNGTDAQTAVRNYCHSLGSGYRIPDMNDYTNTNRRGWSGGIPGRNKWAALRQLSYQTGGRWIGGILNEWGCIVNDWNAAGSGGASKCNGYTGTDWDSYMYWSADVSLSGDYKGKGMWVISNVGAPRVFGDFSYSTYRAVCVTP
ncbi:MAG: hypothetical protein J6580_07850 [Gilliamella sp.]|uniref:hypothetical protein n=1 Tax=Gilliamella sp. TaxID=1891236 RepID=UPI0025FE8AA1|nr:hypothetical protein [Gilliamella sp.]MCO6550580.1 hypothetical protein [Gilliamella sp.]